MQYIYITLKTFLAVRCLWPPPAMQWKMLTQAPHTQPLTFTVRGCTHTCVLAVYSGVLIERTQIKRWPYHILRFMVYSSGCMFSIWGDIINVNACSQFKGLKSSMSPALHLPLCLQPASPSTLTASSLLNEARMCECVCVCNAEKELNTV